MSHMEAYQLLEMFRTRGGLTVPQIVGNMAMIGLVDPDAPEPIVHTLQEAVRKGIMEVSESGRGYTSLNFKSTEPVLMRRGQGFVKGGLQDRVIKGSRVYHSPTTTTFDVYCIEQGRWGGKAPEWEPKDVPTPIRRIVADGHDQSQMWSYITTYLNEWNLRSGTSALSTIYDALGDKFQKFVGNFEWWMDQVGMVVIINGVVAGVEMFDSHKTFHSDGMSLLRDSYIPEAMRTKDPQPLSPQQVKQIYQEFMVELSNGRRKTDIVHYQDRIVYVNIL